MLNESSNGAKVEDHININDYDYLINSINILQNKSMSLALKDLRKFIDLTRYDEKLDSYAAMMMTAPDKENRFITGNKHKLTNTEQNILTKLIDRTINKIEERWS